MKTVALNVLLMQAGFLVMRQEGQNASVRERAYAV